jgi:hypothetical protein
MTRGEASNSSNAGDRAFSPASTAFRGELSVEEFFYAVNVSLRYHYVYIETPKAGCSTIKRTLINLEVGKSVEHPDFEDIHRRENSPLLSPMQVGDWAGFLRTKPLVFCFCRNPYDRLLSGYLDKIARPGPFRRERLRSLGLMDGTISFADFVGALEARDPVDFDAHWRPQHVQTCIATMQPSFVGRLENLEHDLGLLLARLGADFAAAYRPETRNRTSARARHGEFYTAALRARVHAIYRRDFELFGYPV